ncbi:MAG: oligosaccharide flippase family protein [Gammaproteobacteria bacterium]
MTLLNPAHARRNKIIKTAWSGLAAKIVTITVSLLMVPLAVHYLGEQQYGLWVAISSLVAMLGFMDGGAGNAVINLAAHASGAKNDDLAKIVSTSFFSLIAISLIGCLLFLGALPYVPWISLLGIAESNSQSNLNLIVLIVGLFFFVNMFATLVGKIQRGLQEGNLDNFWSGVGAVLSLLFVYIAIQTDAGLIGFVIAFLGGSILSYLASNIHYLFFRRKDLRPRLAQVDSAIAKNLFSVGGMFFILQISGAIQGQADNVIIANMLGPAAVTNYAICMKLFLMVPMLFSLLLTPLWPAYREAFASGDMLWVTRIFLKSIRWALLISLPSAFALVMLGGKIIELWVGHEAVPATDLLIGSGIWLVFTTIGCALAVFLNGLQLVKIQLIVATSAGFMNIIISIWLIQLIGVAGAVFGSVVSYFICTLLPYFFIIRKMLKKLDKQSTSTIH